MANVPSSATRQQPIAISVEEEPRRHRPQEAKPCPACAALATRFRHRALDASREQRRQERAWNRSKKSQAKYARQLRSVADQIDRLVKGIPPDDPNRLAALEGALAKYSEVIEPWAQTVAGGMLADVQRRDEKLWDELSDSMSRAMREELERAPTGAMLKQMLDENVKLITSLPIDAGRRVHELVLRRLETSGRAQEISDEIMRTGEVTRARANLIARTEVARASSGLVQSRAEFIGSEGYIWRSSEDSDVRNKDGNPIGSHRLLNGKFIKWSDPPVASTNGVKAHAGQIYNCRCWPDPVIPQEL